MIIQKIEIQFIDTGISQTLYIDYKSDRGLTFTQFLYQFIQSDADACKFNKWSNDEIHFIITKGFLKNKLIEIKILETNTNEQ
jgi:hypothetical protein